MSNKRGHLVSQHIERLSRSMLEQHPNVIREYVRGKRGVYALYKGGRLYYVGLASNLRSRLRAHLRDRHAGAWDFFSMYLTDGEQHLRELEALVLRITMPRGNLTRTKFVRSQDLRGRFRRMIAAAQRAELKNLFGLGEQPSAKSLRRARGRRQPPLALYVRRSMRIRRSYKGTVYHAVVLRDGTIRLGGRVFNSPSQAAVSITHRPINGWSWWRYEKANGGWAQLDDLRH